MKKARVTGPIKLRSGDWQITVYPGRRRQKFRTKAEASAKKLEIERQQHTGVHSPDAHKVLFATAVNAWLDHERERRGRKEISPARLDNCESTAKCHLLPDLGRYALSEFEESQMQIAQKWLNEKAKHNALSVLKGLRSAVKLVLDAAVRERFVKRSPMKDYPIRVPEVEEKPREVPTLEEIDAAICAGLQRQLKEHEASFRSGVLAMLLQLGAGLRDQECTGLKWECLQLDDRLIYIRWSYKKDLGVVPLTKTGKDGYRDIPMSPIVHAALSAQRDRMLELGREPVGPVLLNDLGDVFRPDSIRRRWSSIAKAAGLKDESGANLYTPYTFRHTAASMWRAAGMELDDIQELMGHTTLQTTTKVYLHRAPHLHALRRDIPDLIEQLRLERTPEGVIEALGIYLARRVAALGVQIPVSPPRSATALLTLAERRALPAPNVLTLVPTSVAISGAQPVDSGPLSLEALRLRQRAKNRELRALGVTRRKRAEQLGVSAVSVGKWDHEADDRVPMKPGRPKGADAPARRAVKEQVLADFKDGLLAREVAKKYSVTPGTATRWANEAGLAVAKAMTPQRAARARQMIADGKSNRAIGAALGVSDGTIRLLRLRIGGQRYDRTMTPERDAQKARISAYFADGRSKSEIARLEGVNRKTVVKMLAESHGIRHSPGDAGTELAILSLSDAAD
jgi:integrase/transposase